MLSIVHRGKLIHVEDDVLDIAKRLKELDPRLKVWYNTHESLWCVFGTDDKGEWLVGRYPSLDASVIDSVSKAMSTSYSLADEGDRIDAEREREADRALYEASGELGERLAHAIRSDLKRGTHVEGHGSVYLPPHITGTPNKVFINKHYKDRNEETDNSGPET